VADKIVDESIVSSTRGIGESCLDEPPNSGCEFGQYNWSIIIPEYPHCIFEISLDYYVCGTGPVGGSVAIHVGDFEILSHNCQDFVDDQQDALANGDEAEFNISFNQSIWRQVTSNIINGTGILPGVNSIIELEYNIGACKFQCSTSTLDCGEACCRRHNTYTVIAGRWVLTTERDIVRFGSCGNPPFCNPSVLQSADCYDNCESLNF
jgi:hypothetical protein